MTKSQTEQSYNAELKMMIRLWNKHLNNSDTLSSLKTKFQKRYNSAHKKTPNNILWVPTNQDFYYQATVEIQDVANFRYPTGDIYLPGYDADNKYNRDYNPNLQLSFSEAILLFTIHSSNQDAINNLLLLVTEQVDDNWRAFEYGLIWLEDLLALRFINQKHILDNKHFFISYFNAISKCVEQVSSCWPNESIKQITAYKSGVRLIHDTLCMDLIYNYEYRHDLHQNDNQNKSIFILALDEKTLKNHRYSKDIIESFEYLFSQLRALSKQLTTLFKTHNNSQHNAIRLLDPYCYIFTSFSHNIDWQRDVIHEKLNTLENTIEPTSDAGLFLVTERNDIPQPIREMLGKTIIEPISSKKKLYNKTRIFENGVTLKVAIESATRLFNMSKETNLRALA